MKMRELMESIKTAEEATEDWYATRNCGLTDLYYDICDAMDEGYIEGIKRVWRPKNGCLDILCEDGILTITSNDNTLAFERERKNHGIVAPTRMSPYERTRAMVYATGNRWAIENFEATHC